MSKLQFTKLEYSDVRYDKNDWRFVMDYYNQQIARHQGSLFGMSIKEVFSTEEIIERFTLFCFKHWDGFKKEMIDGVVNGDNKETSTFFELMHTNYKISYKDILSITHYICFQMNQRAIEDVLNCYEHNTLEAVFRSYISNISNSERIDPVHERILSQYLIKNKLKLPLLKNTRSFHASVFKKMKLEKFDNELTQKKNDISKAG